jgi:predicted  nucleic acid-binding Zn-ribbon protein
MAALEEATKRLEAALGALEATVGRRLHLERRRGDLETELQIMQDDRARLAVELESAAARLEQLENATGDVSRRVHRAVGAVREVIDRAEAAGMRE